jgi:hypothetical protein
MRLQLRSLVAALAILCTVGPMAETARAVDIVLNGSFEILSNGSAKQFNTGSTGAGYTSATDWSSTYLSGNQSIAQQAYVTFATATDYSQTGSGAVNTFGSNLKFWGTIAASPDGGNILASQADWGIIKSSISQTISGLTAGETYDLSFDYAAAQQNGVDGAFNGQWQITFGSETYNTVSLNVPNHGFSGWQSDTTQFTASSTTQELSFIAYSSSSGLQPFMLLDAVKLQTQQVPEPSTYALGAIASGVMAVLARRRKSKLVKSLSI